jgi:DNA-binding response OmpR family regulator
LIVEDNERDAAMLTRELNRAGYDVQSERVETAAALDAALDRQSWDIVLSDYSMPLFSATAALAQVRERGFDMPFIIVSGTIGEETAVAAMRAGANDFMSKAAMARLLPAIDRELREAAARAERKKMREQLMISDRMASVGMLSASVAHEINNPLAVIMGSLDLLGRHVPADSREAIWVQQALEGVRRVRDIVMRMTHITKVESTAVQGNLPPMLDIRKSSQEES